MQNLPSIFCLAMMGLAFLLAPTSSWTLLVSLPVLLFIPGDMAQAVFLRRLDHWEGAMVAISFSALISLAIYVALSSFIGPDAYPLTYPIVGGISLALMPLVSLKGGKPLSHTCLPFLLSFNWRSRSLKEKALVLFIVGCSIGTVTVGALVLSEPQAERFSEFYILNAEGKAYDLPRDFVVGVGQEIRLGIANHEGRTVNYYVEIWQVNYSLVEMILTPYEMYYLDGWNVTLDSVDIDLNSPYAGQYERPYVVSLAHPGDFALIFLLYQQKPALPEDPMDPQRNYALDVNATSRMLDIVNDRVQHLLINIHAEIPYTSLTVNGKASPSPRVLTIGTSLPLKVEIGNHEGLDMNYTLEVWAVNFTVIDMAVAVHEMYFIDAYVRSLPFAGFDGPDVQWSQNVTVSVEHSGNYSIFFLLFKGDPEPMPEVPPRPDVNYAFTVASWRIVMCVNGSLQYAVMNVSVPL